MKWCDVGGTPDAQTGVMLHRAEREQFDSVKVWQGYGKGTEIALIGYFSNQSVLFLFLALKWLLQ